VSGSGVDRNGTQNQEGWDRRQIRHEIRCVAEEAGEEDRGVPARHVHVCVLREGLGASSLCGDLEVQGLLEDSRWRSLVCEHCYKPHRQRNHQKTEGTQRPLRMKLFQELLNLV